jgi:hypothetical protein
MKTNELKARIVDILINDGVHRETISRVINLMGVPTYPQDIPIPRETLLTRVKPALNIQSVRAATLTPSNRSYSIDRLKSYEMIVYGGLTLSEDNTYRWLQVGDRRDDVRRVLLEIPKAQPVPTHLIKEWIITNGLEIFIETFPYGKIYLPENLTQCVSMGIGDSTELQFATFRYGHRPVLVRPSRPALLKPLPL